MFDLVNLVIAVGGVLCLLNKERMKIVDGGVAVFFCEGGNVGGEILLLVLLGSLPPAALIAFLVDLLILVVV
jgi:hypothetical protein